MLENNKIYWRGLEELNPSEDYLKNSKNEFSDSPAESESGSYRRDFLKMMGFSLAAASLAACETPVRKAIPYLIKPEDIDPTIPNYYSSSFVEGGNYSSILVKTREGRPIKIEGNKNSSISKGGLMPTVSASVLSLYDKERFTGPMSGNSSTTWEDLDKNVISKLADITSKGGKIRLVSNTILSPSLNLAISEFLIKYPTAKLVTYDADSASGILNANFKSFGKSALPSLDFEKANIIVSINADFLSTWISPGEYTKQYITGRKVGKSKKVMSRHYQFETTMSLTGSNADFRSMIKPSEEGLVVATLYNSIAAKLGLSQYSVDAPKVKFLDKAVDDLIANKGKSLVVSGSNDTNIQVIVCAINSILGNYGSTLDIINQSNYRKGSDLDMTSFINEVKSGSISSVIFLNSNPVYNHSQGKELKSALTQVALKISITDRPDETSVLSDYIATDTHFLESWGDAEPKSGYYSVIQPSITPLFKSRQSLETFLVWSGKNVASYDYVKAYWKSNLFAKQTNFASFNDFWDRSLHNGVFEIASTFVSSPFVGDILGSINQIKSSYSINQNIDFTTYQKISLGIGIQSNNPWLQEMPDPISKACWDNYITISGKLASEKGLVQNDVVNLVTNRGTIKLPILVQPGQAYNTVSVAVGYGREVSGKVSNGVGKNAFLLLSNLSGTLSNFGQVIKIDKVDEKYEIAQTQTHHTMMSRNIVQETTLDKYVKDPSKVTERLLVVTSEGKKRPEDITIWDTKGNETHDYKNHFWGLVIDLNSCTGCGTCMISCQSENNVPVVGKQEVINRREMHWIRIDRYYSTDADITDRSLSGYGKMEDASDSPQVVFQPVMCQHCNNAPCETVCPVLATTHSTEGLNQMTYNRCVGTRYCANNCPYKVRRFNWFKYYENTKFDYNLNNDLGKMVLNPDVTVRARGVMEKCSMCVQRIQLGKLTAKLEKRRPIDGEIETACSSACPTQAITFGDMNDEKSRISIMMAEEKESRLYHLLEEINVKPSVSYLTKVRNA